MQRVRKSPETRRARLVARSLLPLLVCGLTACGESPEELIVGRWKEVDARYEKYPEFNPRERKFIDGVRFPQYDDRRIVRHESESWEFRPGQELVMIGTDGTEVKARWRLKGRGHVLTIRHRDSGDLEIYDIKKLTGERMLLYYDIGMEVRGIARLEFRRIPESGGPDA